MSKTQYISDGTWFDKGTNAELLIDMRPACDIGLFRGIRNGDTDEETCGFDEFEVIDAT